MVQFAKTATMKLMATEVLLGRPAASAAGAVDWIRQHQSRLQGAHRQAAQRLAAAADTRASRAPPVGDSALAVGDNVYLINRVIGRNKIQDRWRSELYVVTAQPSESVVRLRPLAGGREQTVNRRDVRPARALTTEAPQPPSRPARPEPGSLRFSDSDTEDEEEQWVFIPAIPRQRPVPRPRILRPERVPRPQTPPQRDIQDVAPAVNRPLVVPVAVEPPPLPPPPERPAPTPRRSTRSTAGRNPNPLNLPRSILQ